MKFIISTFSPKIFSIIEGDFTLDWAKHIPKNEFLAECYDAYSCVGYKDVAKMLNVAHNKEPVKARIGDTLLLADVNDGVIEYHRIHILPKFPSFEADELEYLEEEMI